MRSPDATSRRVVFVVFLFLLVLPVSVRASQIVYRDVTLEQAATRAATIMVATYLSTEDSHGTVFRFRVERVLVGTGPAVGAEVRVRRAHYSEWTFAMRVAESSGVRRSPLIDRLPTPPSVGLSPAGRYCLLLDDHSVDPDALEFAVEGGVLSEAECAQVAALHGGHDP